MTNYGRSALATFIPALLLSGCASVPADLSTDDVAETSFVEWMEAPRSDVPALWGGSVRGAFAIGELRCLEVDALPLDRHAHPRGAAESLGGFAACHPTLEAGTYARGQHVTVRGTVRAVDISLDAADAALPALVVDHLHAWQGSAIRAARNDAGPVQFDRREPFSAAIRLHQISQFDAD
ncbi:MAG: hypothetical protein CVT76_06905 [Alphaproteobacteria bacterium HGW-Alphaproteobacteria-15]|nr:MAG: hypothetical protein CVT76_06905 [Alphaproteobacteria bacterium HGW-Alphaproteobacteria-15]